MIKIRLHGTTGECAEAVKALATLFALRSVSDPYPDRGHSILVRVYVEAESEGQ